jgi:hypothetical protein
MELLQFWIRCIFKAFWDSAFFIGTNKTGIAYAAIITVASVVWSMYRRAKTSGGWTAVIRSGEDLLAVFGSSAIIAFCAWGLVFFGHLISAPYGLYSDAEAGTRQANAASYQKSRECGEATKRLSDNLAGIKADLANANGKDEVLNKQNRDQQSTIDGCLSQAMKLLTPEALKTTPLVFDNETVGEIKKVRWLVIANKTITPVQMNVSCDKPLEDGSVWIVGSGLLAGGAGKVGPQVLGVNISTPAWSPTSPLLITMSYRGGGDIACHFALR